MLASIVSTRLLTLWSRAQRITEARCKRMSRKTGHRPVRRGTVSGAAQGADEGESAITATRDRYLTRNQQRSRPAGGPPDRSRKRGSAIGGLDRAGSSTTKLGASCESPRYSRMQSRWRLSRGLGIANLMNTIASPTSKPSATPQLRSQGSGPGPAGRLLDQDHLPAGIIGGPAHR